MPGGVGTSGWSENSGASSPPYSRVTLRLYGRRITPRTQSQPRTPAPADVAGATAEMAAADHQNPPSKAEVIAEITDYLFEGGPDSPSKAEITGLIEVYQQSQPQTPADTSDPAATTPTGNATTGNRGGISDELFGGI